MTNVFYRLLVIIGFLITQTSPQEVVAQKPSKTEPPVTIAKCWTVDDNQNSAAQIATDNNSTVFFSSTSGVVEARDIRDGKLIWHADLGGQVVSEIIYDGDHLYLVTVKEQENAGQAAPTEVTVRSLSVLTGLTAWQRELKGLKSVNGGDNISIVEIEKKLFILSDFGSIFILDPSNGDLVQNVSLDTGFSSLPAIADANIYFGGVDKSILTFSADKKELVKVLDVKDTASFMFVAKDGDLIVGDAFGWVYAVDLDSKKVKWKMRTGAGVREIIAGDDNFLVSSNDNYIYAVSDGGSMKWKKRLTGRTSLLLSEDKTLVLSATLNTPTLTVSRLDSGKTVNVQTLDKAGYFVRRLLHLKHFIIAPTNTGFVVYEFGKCDAHG